MKNIFKTVLLAASLILVLFSFTAALAEKASDAESRIIAVSLFKNGLGFVTEEVSLKGGNKNFILQNIPVPVHGTFWAHFNAANTDIDEIRAFRKEIPETRSALNLSEILEANEGDNVILKLADRTVAGRLLKLPDASAAVQLPVSYSVQYPRPQPSPSAQIFLIQTDEEIIALNKSSVQEIKAAPGGDLKTVVTRPQSAPALEIKLSRAPSGGKILIQYLTKGITWAPSYAVDLISEDKARLTLKAEIINEIGNIDKGVVNFISGYPNFQFSEIVSPIAMQGNLASFLNSLNSPQRRLGGAVMTQQVMYNVAGDFSGPSSDYISTEGQEFEELFFYEKKDITLKTNERGYYPLLNMEIPYEHIYEWKIDDTLDNHGRYNAPSSSESKEEVWHSLKLKNTGKIPWTTAPAMTTQFGQLLGQDIIHYTSPGGNTNLRITQAVDIKAEQAEFEVSRQRRAETFYGSYYDLVEIKGVLNITNFKNKEVVVTTTKLLSGEEISSTREVEIETIAKGLKRVNPRNRLTWEISVPANEKTVIEYSYKVYIRN